VFNEQMKRSLVAGAAALACMCLSAPAAWASIVEIGATKSAVVAPTCAPNIPPVSCTIILTRSTALETIRDSIAYPTTVKSAGYIVAFTVGLGAMSSDRATRRSIIHNLDVTYGGTTRLALTVLKPVGAKRLRQWSVVAESPIIHVQPYLGEVVQFPLPTALPVQKGDTIALTTPTWAPVLSILQPTKAFAYRQSRHTGCPTPATSSVAQLRVGATTAYQCDYPGTRVEYSATEVTTPSIPKNYVHSPRR
jgi:hypothetical protein